MEMTPATKYAYERLSKLNDHADLHEYGPDLLIGDVQTMVSALASAEREIEDLRERLVIAMDVIRVGTMVMSLGDE